MNLTEGIPNIQSPGVFTGIPICSLDNAFHGWLWRWVSVTLYITRSKLTLDISILRHCGMDTHARAYQQICFSAVQSIVQAAMILLISLECAYPTGTKAITPAALVPVFATVKQAAARRITVSASITQIFTHHIA
jgi:hypothetical protein